MAESTRLVGLTCMQLRLVRSVTRCKLEASQKPASCKAPHIPILLTGPANCVDEPIGIYLVSYIRNFCQCLLALHDADLFPGNYLGKIPNLGANRRVVQKKGLGVFLQEKKKGISVRAVLLLVLPLPA